MARLSDKEFSLRYELTQLQRDRNRLERLKERTDADLLETRQRIKAIKDELSEKPKPKKKAAPKVSAKKLIEKIEKNEKTFEAEDVDLNEGSEKEQTHKVKLNADSLVALEDSVELEEKKPEIQQGFKNAKIRKTSELKVEVKEKKPVEKKTKEKEDEKIDPAE